ncbi:helix-turn-helix transcriptional regulator [Agromyces intestinalis]|uniref:helix-turn-helix transcriptional regulator n=1 Tax=Agromyces intestinalis TaxID=2592652 RepID=UPI00143E07CD|nr:LuxR family transcriptional regulator [Agromyces intestinalis]
MTTSVSSPEMVGRQADLSWLEGLLDEARQSAPRTGVLGGEAGIGKTRLIAEFTRRLDDDVRVLAGQCVDLGEVAAPYAPVKAALRSLVAELGPDAVLDAVGPGRAGLVALLPELAGPEASAGTPMGGPEATGRLHEAIAVLLETISRERTTVLVIEDLHWVDAATLALLRFLMRALTSSRVLIVLTYRTEDIGRGHPVRGFLTEIERDRWVDRRELSRLTRAQVRKLARVLMTDDPTAAQVDSVYGRSEGVPFFVEELIGIGACRVGTSTLPDTLRDLLLARYEPLSEATQSLLRLISTGGVRVPHALLEDVFPGTPDELDRAARDAVLAGVLIVDGEQYAFRHALVREAILADLLPGERARFHAAYADAYERLSAAGGRRLAAEISFHWLGAHNATKAFPATIQAMREARASAAYATAAQLGERAISLWDVVPDPVAAAGMDKIELMGRTTTYLRNAGESERALALVKAAIAECPDDNARLARLLRDQALVVASLGRDGSIPILREALARVAAIPSPDFETSRLRASVMTALAGRLMIDGQIDEAIDIAEEAHALAIEFDTDRSASVARNVASVSRISRGEVAEGLAGLEEARRLAHGDGAALLRYWVNASDARYLVGDHESAVQHAEQGLERARAQGLERSSGVILASNAVDPLQALGEWQRADELIDRALALDPPGPFRVYLLRARIWARLWRGDPEGAAAEFRGVRAIVAPVMAVEAQTRLGVGRLMAELALESGDLAEARSAVGIGVDESATHHLGYVLPYLWTSARLIETARRDTAAAEAAGLDAGALTALEERVREQLADVTTWPTYAVWAPFVEAELTEPGDEQAVDAWRAAVEAATHPASLQYLDAYARLRLGEAVLATGERQLARAELRAARDTAERDGVGLVVRHVDRVAEAAGLSVSAAGAGDEASAASSPAAAAVPATDDTATDGAGHPPDDPGLDELTARERQVLGLIAEGLSNRQIGERLYISGKTASVHVSAILRKLGASTRTEAAVRAGALR